VFFFFVAFVCFVTFVQTAVGSTVSLWYLRPRLSGVRSSGGPVVRESG